MVGRRAPVVAVEPDPSSTAAWTVIDVERPAIASESGAAWSSWSSLRATRATHDGPTIVAACVSAPVPGWVEDMRPPFEARTVAIAAGAASRAHGLPLETFDGPEDRTALALRPVGTHADPLGYARTFLGFHEDHVASCFVVCTASRSSASSAADASACAAIVGRARLEGGTPPPSPGVMLAAATWAVHHSRTFAAGVAAFVVVAGVLAVALRRRPRART